MSFKRGYDDPEFDEEEIDVYNEKDSEYDSEADTASFSSDQDSDWEKDDKPIYEEARSIDDDQFIRKRVKVIINEDEDQARIYYVRCLKDYSIAQYHYDEKEDMVYPEYDMTEMVKPGQKEVNTGDYERELRRIERIKRQENEENEKKIKKYGEMIKQRTREEMLKRAREMMRDMLDRVKKLEEQIYQSSDEEECYEEGGRTLKRANSETTTEKAY